MNKGRENDLTFINHLFKFAKLIGITTSFPKTLTNRQKLQILFTTIFVVAFFFWAFHFKLGIIKNPLELYTDLLATSILAIFTVYTILAFGFFKRKNYYNFILLITSINNSIPSIVNVENRFSYQIEVAGSYLFMLSLIITALFTEVHDVGSLYHLFYKFFNNTFMVTLTLILRNFAVCLKYRFLKVNLKLIEGQVKYIKTYLSLLEATEHFNKLFEWELFILAIRNVTWTISIAQIFSYGVKTNRLIIGNIILNCIRGSLGWIMLFLVSLSCSDLSKEANKILLIKNVKTFPFGATEIKKINVLKKLIQDKVEINAAGFFRIDKSGLFALTGVVMAYIIVLIQLNKIDF